MTHHPFFYKFDYMDLMPGNKLAGFNLVIATDALIALSKVPLLPDEQARMIASAQARIRRADLLSARTVKSATILFHNNSGCPRIFLSDPMFGGSIGPESETFSRLERSDALQWLGPTVTFTPHNVDAPKASLAIMLLAQTWAEWADLELADLAREARDAAQAMAATTIASSGVGGIH